MIDKSNKLAFNLSPDKMTESRGIGDEILAGGSTGRIVNIEIGPNNPGSNAMAVLDSLVESPGGLRYNTRHAGSQTNNDVMDTSTACFKTRWTGTSVGGPWTNPDGTMGGVDYWNI